MFTYHRSHAQGRGKLGRCAANGTAFGGPESLDADMILAAQAFELSRTPGRSPHRNHQPPPPDSLRKRPTLASDRLIIAAPRIDTPRTPAARSYPGSWPASRARTRFSPHNLQ